MLLFKNNDKQTYFLVDVVNNKVIHCSNREHCCFIKFSDCFGGITYLTLPDLATVHKFRKIVETGVVHNMKQDQAKAYLIDQYPELFI